MLKGHRQARYHLCPITHQFSTEMNMCVLKFFHCMVATINIILNYILSNWLVSFSVIKVKRGIEAVIMLLIWFMIGSKF